VQKGLLRKVIGLMGLVVLTGFFIAAGMAPPVNASEKPIRLKLSSWLPEMGTQGKILKWWGSELEKRSNGRVKVDYYFAQALVKTMDSLPAVSTGIADVQFVADGYFPTQLPLMGGLHLLYQTESGYLMDKAETEMFEVFPPFKKMMKDNNIKLMMSLSAGGVAMASVKPIKTLEDLHGKRVRAMGLMNKAMKLLGATPVAIPLPEVYEALERGIVDVVTGIPYNLIDAFKFQEVAKYIIDTKMGCYASGGYYMNLDTWNKLPDDIKAIVRELTSQAPEVYADLTNKLLKKTTDALLKAKCRIYSLSPEEVERWKAKLVPRIYDDWIKEMEKRGLPGRETIELYQKLIKKYQPQDKYISPYVSR